MTSCQCPRVSEWFLRMRCATLKNHSLTRGNGEGRHIEPAPDYDPGSAPTSGPRFVGRSVRSAPVCAPSYHPLDSRAWSYPSPPECPNDHTLTSRPHPCLLHAMSRRLKSGPANEDYLIRTAAAAPRRERSDRYAPGLILTYSLFQGTPDWSRSA